MKRCLLVIILALCCVACDNHSTHWGTLTDVESYIEERPDSALVVLERIDVSVLASDEERAKHALLLSMAMDKNYIDRTDFEVLQPAIDRVLSPNGRGGWTPLRPLRGFQETRDASREESGVLGFPSRRGLTPRGSLECNPEIPAFPGEEY